MKNNALKLAPAAVLAGAAVLLSSTVASAQTTLYSEDFENLKPLLAPPVDEVGRGFDGQPGWTHFLPLGWTRDDSGVPIGPGGMGSAEWAGWSFADKTFWATVSGDQTRTQFTRASGVVAVADPDEYDDYRDGIPGNAYYDVLMTTPQVYIGTAAAGSLRLVFDSSWRPEGFDDGDNPQDNNQTALIRASYDGGVTWTEVSRWDSDVLGDFFKPDAQNENVSLVLNPPANAKTVMIEFGCLRARNDWWWAVDNIKVTATIVANTRSISGTVSRAECTGPFDAKFVLTPSDNSGVITVFGKVNNSGAFTIPAVPNKNYSVRVKSGNTLSRVVSANATAGNVTGLSVSPLLGGDSNDDDSVDVFDLADLITAFDAAIGVANFNPGTDFNCDGSVDVFDLAVLISNFDQTGE